MKYPDFLLIDKDSGMTSYDVVHQIKNVYGIKRVGHLGTLDPFATGLLVIALGSNTRLLPYLQGLNKYYSATACLGATSTTGDPEGEIAETGGVIPTRRAVSEVVDSFLGEQEQTPPQYSAVKVNGERAYKLAREGRVVNLKPKIINIYDLNVTDFDPPKLSLDVACSTGTYIRRLAEDIGEKLGCGAYLTALRRTQIGDIKIMNAGSLNDVSNGERSASEILANVLHSLVLKESEIKQLEYGKSWEVDSDPGDYMAVFDNQVLAIGGVVGGIFQPHTVLMDKVLEILKK